MNDYDRQEDIAALRELVQDVEGEMAYLEFNYEYGFEKGVDKAMAKVYKKYDLVGKTPVKKAKPLSTDISYQPSDKITPKDIIGT